MIVDVHGNRRMRKRARRARAFLNGQEITHSCFYADTRRGVVRVLLTNAEGRHYVDPATGRPAMAERHGQVRVTFRR